MSWWTVLKYFVLGIFCSAEWIGERRRIHAMRALARKFGLAFLGKKRLPEALSLYGTPFAHIQLLPVANLIDGMRNGVRVIVFDGEVWEGKTFWRRTVVAARAPENVFAGAASNPEVKIDRSAAWSILYHPKGFSAVPEALTPVEELEAIVDGIGVSALAAK
jgi:hypothetical protein